MFSQASLNRPEQMCVESFISEPPVEALDEAIFHRPAWSNEFELYSFAIGPAIDRLRAKLRTVYAKINPTIPPWTPIPRNAVIAFTLPFCPTWRGAKGEGKRITALSHKHATHKDHEQVVFSIEFSTKFEFGDNSTGETETINCCRKTLTKVKLSERVEK